MRYQRLQRVETRCSLPRGFSFYRDASAGSAELDDAEHTRDITYLSALHRYTRRSITTSFDALVIGTWGGGGGGREEGGRQTMVQHGSCQESHRYHLSPARERISLANFLITFLHPLSGSSPRQYYLKLRGDGGSPGVVSSLPRQGGLMRATERASVHRARRWLNPRRGFVLSRDADGNRYRASVFDRNFPETRRYSGTESTSRCEVADALKRITSTFSRILGCVSKCSLWNE